MIQLMLLVYELILTNLHQVLISFNINYFKAKLCVSV